MALTERIIENVRNHPILYDLSHPDYKNIRKKDKIWDEIGLELGESGESLKKKWKNLRDSYAKYLRCMKNYQKWRWAKQMGTFRRYLAFAQTDSNISDIKEDGYDMQISPVTDENLEFEEENVVSLLDSDSAMPQISERHVISPSPSTNASSSLHTSKCRRALQTKDNNNFSVDAVINYLENKRPRTEMTANDLIFSGYAKTVSSFSLKRQAITKMKIAQIMMEQELLNIEEMEAASRPSSRNFEDISHTSTYSSPTTPPGCNENQNIFMKIEQET